VHEKKLNLTADERATLTKLVRDNIAVDPYPLSPRIGRLKALLAKLDPSAATQAVAAPLPPPKAWVNSSIGQRKRRR
jgi:hypothetical protein